MGTLVEVGIWLQNWANVINAIGSILLTTALVGLYYAQHGILKEQLQKKIDPQITTEQIRVEYLPDLNKSYEHYFVLTLSNIGNGEATDMSITIEPTLIDLDYELESINRDLSRKPVTDDISAIQLQSKGNHLQPQERDVDFIIESVAGVFFEEGAPMGGHFPLSELPEAIVRADLDTNLSPSDFPDRETEEKIAYAVSFPNEERVASVVSDELDFEDLPVDIEEKSRTKLKDKEIRDIINTNIGTMFVRIKLLLNYKTSDGNTKKQELLDKVFPSRYGVPDSVLFKSGMDYSSFNLKGDKKSSIERRMYVNIAQEENADR